MKSNHSLRNPMAILAVFALGIVALFSDPFKLVAQTGAPGQSAAKQNTGAPAATAPPPGVSQLQPQGAEDGKAKTAGEAFKNIQVLKGIREDELRPSMRYIAAALGVNCEFCHVPNHFETDDKPEKARARDMMKMMFATNADNFHGHREITCYTCHRGNSHPVGTPAIPDAATIAAQTPPLPPPPNGEPPRVIGGEQEAGKLLTSGPSPMPLPSVDEILSKYMQSLGGADAMQKVTSRMEKGTVDIPVHDSHSTMEVYRKAPDKALAILHSATGDVTEGFNGTIAWESRAGRGATEETGDSLIRVKEWAAFFPGLDLKQAYTRSMVNGIESIGGRDAYRVFAWRKGGSMERLYFDVGSGLLVRLDTRIDSPLGSLPQQTNFEDYRVTEGVQFPYTIRVARIDSTTIYKWEQVEQNVPVADDRFEKPAMSPPVPPTSHSEGEKPPRP
jgi:photosynthetic reaction center cytochrome c subunit